MIEPLWEEWFYRYLFIAIIKNDGPGSKSDNVFRKKL
jgi:hypothetical protein